VTIQEFFELPPHERDFRTLYRLYGFPDEMIATIPARFDFPYWDDEWPAELSPTQRSVLRWILQDESIHYGVAAHEDPENHAWSIRVPTVGSMTLADWCSSTLTLKVFPLEHMLRGGRA
jgi:hypothetical protein